MKKTMSFFLAVILIVSVLPLTVFAEELSGETTRIGEFEVEASTITEIQDALSTDKNSVIETIADEIETLKSLYLPVENLLDVQCESGEIEYVLDIPSADLVATVSVREDFFGNVTLDFTEGAYHDILVVKVDGTILLNGSEVTMEIIDCECSDDSTTLAYGSYRCSETSMSNYSPQSVYSLSSTKKVIFDFGDTKLKDVLVGAFTTILGICLGNAVGGAVGGEIGRELGSAVGSAVGYFAGVLLNQLKSVARSYCPSSTAAGCVLSTYTSNLSNALDRYYKFMGSYYASYNPNTGTLSYFVDTVTFYGHNYFC